jgi:aspartyl-tRNA(Asn)/glutamyl-tRNA(Gln) amidotransferase subunit A
MIVRLEPDWWRVLARSAKDCAHVLAAIAGHDPRCNQHARPVDDYVGALSAKLLVYESAWREYFGAGVEDASARP